MRKGGGPVRNYSRTGRTLPSTVSSCAAIHFVTVRVSYDFAQLVGDELPLRDLCTMKLDVWRVCLEGLHDA